MTKPYTPSESHGLLERIAHPFVVFVERYYPDPIVFALLLTFITLAMSVVLTPAGPSEALTAWGDGLPSLLAFTAQLSITLLAAHALAHTDSVRRGLNRLADLPSKAYQTYALVALTAGLCHLIAWSLGLIAGALIARQVGIRSAERGLKVHYPLLVAAAYSGIVVWHMGYSGSAPLFVATPGHILEAQIGIIPVSETIFYLPNILLAIFTVLLIAIICPLMRPSTDRVVEVDIKSMSQTEVEPSIHIKGNATIAQLLDNSRLLNVVMALLFAAYLIQWFRANGFNLNLDIVNWTFLCAGIALARSPAHYIKLIKQASGAVGVIILQYPLYAGIMGLMASTGLGSEMSSWFTNMATAKTLPFLAFLCGGIVNMFVPSGGGQWAVQGPIFIEAAQALGVEPRNIVMAIAYGDQWTNMIQPFWTIPLLAVAGLSMHHIMGYTFVICVATFFVYGSAMLFIFS